MLLYTSCLVIHEPWCCVQQEDVILKLKGILLKEESFTFSNFKFVSYKRGSEEHLAGSCILDDIHIDT